MAQCAPPSRGGAEPFDREGRIVVRGKVDQGLLEELLEHLYFALAPPHDDHGREKFGESYATGFLRRCDERNLRLYVASLTGWSVLDQILAILASILVFKIGLELFYKASHGLKDRSVPEEGERNREIMEWHLSRFVDFHDIKTRRSGGGSTRSSTSSWIDPPQFRSPTTSRTTSRRTGGTSSPR